MRLPGCHMPIKSGDKITRRGNYLNWETVLCHAEYMLSEKTITEEENTFVVDYVSKIVGYNIDAEFVMDELMKTKPSHLDADGVDINEYIRLCSYYTMEKSAVVFAEKEVGKEQPIEILLDPTNGKFDFSKYRHSKTIAYPCKTHKDCVLTCYYNDAQSVTEEANSLASALFHTKVWDPLIVMQKQETAGYERMRLVDFPVPLFLSLVTKKRKKHVEALDSAVDKESFRSVKKQLEKCVNDFEQKSSARSSLPSDISSASAMPAPTGKELKEIATLLGYAGVPDEHPVIGRLNSLHSKMEAPPQLGLVDRWNAYPC